ncbi:MAG: Gfo/Idh/MocA family oxidoreductase [Bacteroidetes bacterium]|nr:Gfo/Idh/MocA family oxidoreductase [Bacteroidota bacterium]
MKKSFKRRDFLKKSALTSIAMGLLGPSFANKKGHPSDYLNEVINGKPAKGKSVIGLRSQPIKQVKVAMLGLGNRGSSQMRLVNALYPDKAKIVAVCDVREKQVDKAMDYLKENGGQKPDTYTDSLDAWKEMVKRDDVDLVVITTPWNDHTPMCVYSMKQGKHVAVEVPAALSVEDCWKLVDTAEATQRNCMMLENVCYGDEELWVLNMAKKGVFGTLTYAEAAYIHNLRDLLFGDAYYNKWRMRHHITTDSNLYPTHGLGPVAQYMGIDRGDRFDYLVSMSSLQASLSEHSQTVNQDNEFYNRTDFKHGDLNNSMIKTAKGRTILVQHDVVTPRPYNRLNLLAGTKGCHEGYPSRLAIDGKGHGWLPKEKYEEYRETYRHSIWDELKEPIKKNGGHGGMDFVQIYRLIDRFNKGLPLDMDVYDAASWSVVTPLSELSVQLGSVPIQFPDFTRGRWKEERELGIMVKK